MKRWKQKVISVILALCLLIPSAGLTVAAGEEGKIELQKTISHTQTSGSTDYFTFAEGKWEAGNDLHTWSTVVDASDPAATWYEVKFTGHKIDVYAGKNWMMGNVKYYIDGTEVGTYSLYNASNINSTLIATYDNLTETEHTFRAEATGEITSNTKIDAAQIVVYYYVDAKESLQGSIVDSGLQYTQDKYAEVSQMSVTQGKLSAWKNDTAVSQISLVSGVKALKNVTVTAGDFTGSAGTISKDQVTTTFIKSVQAYTGMPGWDAARPIVTGDRAEANEVLYQTTPIDMDAASVQNVWISIDVPKGAAAGSYTGTISVSADGIDPLQFTYVLEVADAVLPDAEEFKESFDIELWQNPFASAEYYNVEAFSDAHFEILRSIMGKYKSIGGNAITTTIVDDAWNGQTYSANDVKYPTMIEWIKKTNGTWEFDYTKFDRWIEFNKELGIGDRIICYSIAPWNNQVTYYDEASGTDVTTPLTAGTDTYTTLWTAFLQDLMVHMTAKGWKEQTYIGIDERGFDARAFDLIDSVTGIDGKPFKTAGAMDGFVNKHDLAMRVDVLSVGSIAVKAHPAEFEALRQEREEAGLKTTIYTCTGHIPCSFSLSAPGESYWTMMYTYSVGGQGYMRWAYDSWVENPLEDTTHSAYEAGDCFLIFPDEKTSEEPEAKSSLRLEKMAEGVRDVNKLIQMQKEVPAMAAAVEELMSSVKPTYESGTYYLTDNGKAALAADMNVIKSAIAELTEQYIYLKENGSTEVNSITISEGSEITIMNGAQKQLHAVLTPDNLLNTNVTWTSENENIVKVTKDGTITGMNVGTAKITAVSEQNPDKKAEIQVTVSAATVDADAQAYYYSFDNVDGNIVKDEWGSRNGTAGGVTYVDGKSGNAVRTTSGNTVTFDANTTLTDTWSVGYWMYNESSAEDRVSVITDSSGVRSFDARISSSNSFPGVHVSESSGGFLSFRQNTLPTGTWVHVTWTNDKTAGLRLYINGVLSETNAWTVSNNFTAPIDIIGGTNFVGMIDELKIYNRALTAEEVMTSMQTEGLNLTETYAEILVGETYRINANLISDNEDKTITYVSSDPEIASVDQNGVVTALKKGTVVITVSNKAGGFSETVTVKVNKKLEIQYTIPQYVLPEENLSDIDKDEGGERQYLGQPDMVMLDDNKTLITAYPIGHGCGPLVMKISTDGGETWTEKTDIPSSWADSLETPTIYKLNMTDGSTKLIMITARPNWHGNTMGGWQTSISEDNGKTWSEYQTFHPTQEDGSPNWTIVAMASLVQLHDEDGNPIDKWMGVYHNYSYVNYKTYLTFDENGNQQWSTPEPYLSQYRSIESTYQICEVGMFRSPDGKRIVGLARAQSHQNKSVMFYSDDEGETWSEPEELQGALQGERHKAVYDPISGRLLVTFREIILDYNQNGLIEYDDWKAGDWVAWVGTYEDLMEQNEGQYRILLDEDWANNVKSGDTGYAGVVVQPDGTFIMDSYGHWDKEFSQSWTGGVTTDLCYIRQAKFTLGEIDQALGLVNKSDLESLINTWKNTTADGYTESSYDEFANALEEAQTVFSSGKVQQIQVDAAREALEDAAAGLKTISSTKPIESVSFGKEEDSIIIKEERKLEVIVTPEDADEAENIVWTSSDEEVLTVDEEGNIKAMWPGEATITAESGGKKGSIKVTVYGVEKIYKDVHEDDWYYGASNWTYVNEVMSGYGNGIFGPADQLARAQFATILYRIAGEPEVEFKNQFPDVQKNDWYADAVIWAYQNGIITGYTDTGMFGSSDNITREQLATILYRYTKSKGIDVTSDEDLSDFPDASAVSGFADDAMKWAVSKELIKGDKGRLNPQGNTNRAEAAIIIQRYVKACQD